MRKPVSSFGVACAAAALTCVLVSRAVGPAPPIHFAFRPIGFTLDSCETPLRHAPETMAGGVAIFDYNNDGKPDIFFTNGANIETLRKDAPKFRNRLFRNNGDGTFTDVTMQAGLAGTGYDTAVAVADYDNDGYEDLFVGGVHRNTLYHNNGNGTFSDVTAQAGINKLDAQYGPLWSTGAAWVDVNNDGLLDLFVVNYLSWDVHHEPKCDNGGKPDYCHPKLYKELPNQLFLNRGNGRFEDISSPAGIRAQLGKGMSASVADYDGDGLADIFVTNDKLFNFLFHARGGGRFQEVALDAGVALPESGNLISGMGSDFRDLDNDGLPDIVLTALNGETFPLYRNAGKGMFQEITSTAGLTQLTNPMSAFGVNIADFDNDGWKDIFVARGHVQSPAMSHQLPINEWNSVFRNPGRAAKWSVLTEQAGFDAQPPQRHRGSAVGDLNGDGRIDLVVTSLSAPAEIWINDSANTNNWLEVKLRGTKSNRDGIGAKIEVDSHSGKQFNHMSTASSYASSSSGPVHFGLGPDAGADRIVIRWPSGAVQELTTVSADRVITAVEPR